MNVSKLQITQASKNVSNEIKFIPIVESNRNTKKLVDLPPVDTIVRTLHQLVKDNNPLNFKIMMTNLCNLSCSYCFQQHSKNTIPWTVEGLTLVLDGLIAAFPHRRIQWDWFGGEPLIYINVILEFIKKNKDKLNGSNVSFELSTNGTLLTHEFIQEFYSVANSHIAVSLDTVWLENDNRNLTKDSLTKILTTLHAISTVGGVYSSNVTITLSRDQVQTLYHTLTFIYKMGGRNISVNPLVYDNDTLVDWSQDELNEIATILTAVANEHKDIHLDYGTEVVSKESINCLVGERMLSIDGSGDITGCFSLSNDKDSFTDTTMGNIFTGKINHNIHRFDDVSSDFLSIDPRCNTCDYSNLCTMCPVGVHRTSRGTLYFKSNSSCQTIVKNYIRIRDLMITQNIPHRQNTIKKYNDNQRYMETSNESI